MRIFFTLCITTILTSVLPFAVTAQHSVARQWNEMLLESIRRDFARPTVHARNLFHTSAVMWDAWAALGCKGTPFLMGHTVSAFTCDFDGIPAPLDVRAAREEAISYAAYRLLKHRFANSPGAPITLPLMDELLTDLGYDPDFISTDYSTGSPAALGNYIAQCMIDFGLQDGSNEQGGYANLFYEPTNEPLIVMLPGIQLFEDIPYAPGMADPNRWQPLMLNVFCDQSGNCDTTQNVVIPHLSAEWGRITPFALEPTDATVYVRNDTQEYIVYHDPGPPPFMDTTTYAGDTDMFMWTFKLVALWAAHLGPEDTVMIDISPGALGNLSVEDLPLHFNDHPDLYRDFDGGTNFATGWNVNPYTGQPYAPNIVKRGDYARVLAEFWADGPQSETPPGHWFSILNYVSDHPAFEKRFNGTGPVLDDLEWDVKAYLSLGGAMHDAAITAWGIKGWYDYVRPVSAIREMASHGQSTDTTLSNYHPRGIPLVTGYIEVVTEQDDVVLRGFFNQHVGKIKIRCWRGPIYIFDPEHQTAGIDWIRAENWWPYQQPTFVTPPFSGYISGHSTYSRTAAELMTLLTGSAFFPGGMGEFFCAKNEFLDFENGPSEDLTLQWATYQDASDQTSLSRIWGGIHPPADDIPGRLIGLILGPQAFNKAISLFNDCDDYAGQYVINRNIPRSANTFNSLGEAFRCLSECGISGAVTLNMHPWTMPYHDQIIVNSIPGNNINVPVFLRGNYKIIEIDPDIPFTISDEVVLYVNNLMLRPKN